jgi:pimeloyl-ACP methyl ester carboxylesterase
MSARPDHDLDRPTLFALHYLGGSAREWLEVSRHLRDVVDVVALDLPGFGVAAHAQGYSVEAMAQALAAQIRARAPRRYVLAGHSMGAKIATAVARASEDGADGLAGLVALVLIAGSPPDPEPMSDADRATMLGWFTGDAAESRAQATTYVEKNSARLDIDRTATAVGDVLRMNVAAWRAWLNDGSREDWSQRIGLLDTPTLLIAGEDDENLGPDAQAKFMAPHMRTVSLATLTDAKHLLPLERATDIARLIRLHVANLDAQSSPRSHARATFGALIASERVSTRTRRALLERLAPDDETYAPVVLGTAELATLRAVVDRIVPQTAQPRIDFAARIDRDLAAGIGDGWRFDVLPADAVAYGMALRTLDACALAHDGRGFVDLDDARRDAMLGAIADETFSIPGDAVPDRLDAPRMRAWFEDVRAETVKHYVAHPWTLARIGYSGIANGGDGSPKSGFVRVGPDDREAWEPVAAPEAGA